MGRKGLIAWGMLIQAGGIWLTVGVPDHAAWLAGAALQGLGTAVPHPAGRRYRRPRGVDPCRGRAHTPVRWHRRMGHAPAGTGECHRGGALSDGCTIGPTCDGGRDRR